MSSSGNKPAAVLCVIVALVLLALTLPFVITHFKVEEAEYIVSWSATGTNQAALSSDETTPTSTATVDSQGLGTNQDGRVIPASLMLSFPTCSDTPGPFYGTAQVSWNVKDADGAELATGSGTCGDLSGQDIDIAIQASPDIGTLKAGSLSAAESSVQAESADANVTASYTLTLTHTRSSTLPIGLPVAAPSLDIEATLMLHVWDYKVAEKVEVPK